MAKPVFNVEMLPAKHGDALFVQYGKEGNLRRILIDGGPLKAYPQLESRLKKLPDGDQGVGLLVITHVDTDHIEGIIRLLAMPENDWPIQVGEIWFNGWRHIEEANTLGGREGEMMSALIHARADERWNTTFNREAVCCGKPGADEVQLADGMKLTLLSPDAEALASLLEDWRAKLSGPDWTFEPGDLEEAWKRLVDADRFHPGSKLTLGPGDLTPKLLKLLKGIDPSKANRSSIAFIAEFEGKRCVFLGDAHMDVVCKSLKHLGYSKDKPLKADAVKVSHHGSRKNTTREFLELVDAKHWLFSSNGDKYKHPNNAAVEAVIDGAICGKPVLHFNYRSPYTKGYEKAAQKPKARYGVKYPPQGKEGIVVKL